MSSAFSYHVTYSITCITVSTEGVFKAFSISMILSPGTGDSSGSVPGIYTRGAPLISNNPCIRDLKASTKGLACMFLYEEGN